MDSSIPTRCKESMHAWTSDRGLRGRLVKGWVNSSCCFEAYRSRRETTKENSILFELQVLKYYLFFSEFISSREIEKCMYYPQFVSLLKCYFKYS